VNIACHCPGFEGDAECGEPATEEDGLCDNCRCGHGCCVDHGSPKIGLTIEQRFDRLLAWSPEIEEADLEAWRRWGACRDARKLA